MTSSTQIRISPAPEPARTAIASTAPATEPVAWRHWPLADDWRRIWPMAVLMATVLLAAGFSTGNVGAVLLIAAAFAAASWRIWLPIRYEVNSRGLVQSCLGRVRRVNWSQVRRIEILPHGLLLLKCTEPAPFDAWRGLYVPWGSRGPEVLAVVQQYFQARENVG